LNDGTYKVCVWVKTNGDSNFSNDTLCNTYVLNTTGVFETSISSNILLYPNPTNGQIVNIESEREELRGISINDVNGKQWIVNNQLLLRKVELNTMSLPSGIYFITIQTANGVLVKKWLKQ
jgi:hypothetical protein